MEYNKDCILQAEVSKENGVAIGIHGGLEEIADAVCNIVSAVYNDIKRKSPIPGAIFMAMMQVTIGNPQSPVWGQNDSDEIVDVSVLEGLLGKMRDESCGPTE